MKFGFVILHYLTYEDTKDCIASIQKKVDTNDYYIVIVDNYSNNGTVEKLENDFKHINNIIIIKNEKNLGFAQGNNVGYNYCKKVLKCDYILVLNNDILLESKKITTEIEESFKETNCAIIGPDIISLIDGNHQNPMNEHIENKLDVIKDMIKYKVLYILCCLHLYDVIKKNRKSKKDDPNIVNINTFYQNEMIDVQLHGSFLIFTPLYIKKMDEAFCSKTFLYMEETILYKICKLNNFKTYYNPNIKVLHKEDSSTNSLFNNKNNEKRKFVFKNLYNSLKVLLSYFD